MGYFPSTAAAVLAGSVVRCDLLVFFDFLTTPMRLWQGFGTLHTLDGHDWQGLGELGRIGDLESAIGGTSPNVTFTLSGVDPSILAEALDSSEEVFGRDVNVYMQFFTEDFQPLDPPYVVFAGLMDTLRVKQSAATVSVELSAETLFARRTLPPYGNLSGRDQHKLFPGDTGLDSMPELISLTAIWPVIVPQ